MNLTHTRETVVLADLMLAKQFNHAYRLDLYNSLTNIILTHPLDTTQLFLMIKHA